MQKWSFFSPLGFCRAGTSIANAIDLGSALKVTENGDSSNYPDTALSGCADPADYNNGTMGDGGVVVSGGQCLLDCLGTLLLSTLP